MVNFDIIYEDKYKEIKVICLINVVVIGGGIVGFEVVCMVVEVGCNIMLIEVSE